MMRRNKKTELMRTSDRPRAMSRWFYPWEDLDRMFESFFGDRNLWPVPSDAHRLMAAPHVDIINKDDHMLVKADLPGVPKENVEVEIEDNVLSIKGQVSDYTEEKDEDSNFIRRERRCSSFQRCFMVPEGVDAEKVEASMKDGVLTVNIPKIEPVKPKQVSIEVK